MGGLSEEFKQQLLQMQQGLPQQAFQQGPVGYPQFQPSYIPGRGFGLQNNPGLQQAFNVAQGLPQQQQMQYQPIGQPQIMPTLGQNAIMGGVQGGYNPQPQQQGLGGLQINKWQNRLRQR